MSLKRRNSIALILILLAAVCWTFGQQMLDTRTESSIIATTNPGMEDKMYPTTVATIQPSEDWANSTIPMNTTSAESEPRENDVKANSRSERLLGFILSFTAAAAAGTAIFVFWQKNPICGPDGISFILALFATAYYICQNMEYIPWPATAATLTVLYRVVSAFAILFGIRELLGWMRGGFSLSWCLVHRAAKRCTTPQMSLLIFVGWIVLSLAGAIYFFAVDARYRAILFCIVGYLAAAVFGFLCLWRYGTDLNHFKKQLDNYQHGKPISVGDGAFSQTEAQLLDVQAQHEEAVRTAVTSERFKVELISNVSHDLRTPLTSILGYSELLQKETMTPEGQEQLRLLNQKAGYMRDLVDSLFELTKVSSGVTESKKERIDLIRLLEQTIGLFDDQLHMAGLVVRRHYASNSIIVVTDGARMHQVFANLLTNAIKYALPGTRIHLEVAETDENYRVRMVNTASYEMDFQPEEIVQRFARGDKARSTKGSGLGLAIAQTYTESVGGSFRVAIDGDQFSAIVELPKL